eukprot:2418794-Prymnesium_polylepis.1
MRRFATWHPHALAQPSPAAPRFFTPHLHTSAQASPPAPQTGLAFERSHKNLGLRRGVDTPRRGFDTQNAWISMDIIHR